MNCNIDSLISSKAVVLKLRREKLMLLLWVDFGLGICGLKMQDL